MMTFGACGNTAKEEITVTFMNGETELGKVTGAKGEVLTDYEQYEAIEGFEFLGWYEAPSLLETSKQDLTTATFEEDTTLFGSFKSTQVAEDTRVWYIVGTGASKELAASNWAADVDDSVKEACQLKATGNAVNEFAITLNLYAGDQFQIIHDWSWDGQKGFGYFTSIDETQMENGGGLGGSDSTAISSYTEHREACMEFVNFATSYEMIQKRMDMLGIAPTRSDVAEASGGVTDMIFQSLENGNIYLMPSIKAVDQIWVPTHTLLGDIAKDPFREAVGETPKYSSGQDIQTALEKVDKDIYDAIYTLK